MRAVRLWDSLMVGIPGFEHGVWLAYEGNYVKELYV